jgi:predicted phosphoribosyltransferase
MSIHQDNPGFGFRDRSDAGRALGEALLQYRDWQDPVVLALPRGGVPVAVEVARLLDAPTDVLVVRKIGHPQHEEYAVGAIASGGITVMNADAQAHLGLAERKEIDRIMHREQAELRRREELYRGSCAVVPLQGREVIVVDDGLATGATMRAAVQALRTMNPARITVAVPLGARETVDSLALTADDVVCVRTPEPFRSVGEWYSNFPQVSDEEVHELLVAANRPLVA